MIMENKKEFWKAKKDSKIWDEEKKYNRQCKTKGCFHQVNFFKTDKDRILCPYCKNYVYKDDTTEFRYITKEKMKQFHIYKFEDITLGEILDNEKDIYKIDYDEQTISFFTYKEI